MFSMNSMTTRMHSSRMRTARSLTVSRRILCMPPHNHAPFPPATMHAPHNHTCPLQPHMPPTTMHTHLATMHAPLQPCIPPPPQPRMPPATRHPPATMHAPRNHAHTPSTTHTPLQPRMPTTTMHTSPQPCTHPHNHARQPATTHAPLLQTHMPIATTYASHNNVCPLQPLMPPNHAPWQPCMPPPCGQNDGCLEKHNFPTTSFAGGKKPTTSCVRDQDTTTGSREDL